ncbi:hypothetical protein SDC9_31646 [bioreactor metagenome]|uniref:Uncharacterized protein n=1 Tax=bioreactor metagenome TaxID=1076179 RepID=A0A644V4B8_9ZZZZ
MCESMTRMISTFQTCHRDTADDLLLEKEEYRDEGSHRHRRAGHDVVPVRACLAREIRKTHRQREHPRLRSRDEGPEKSVPVAYEIENRQRRERRRYEGQHDGEEDHELAPPVHPRRVDEIVGNGLHELPHEKHAEGADHTREHYTPVGIDPLEGSRHRIPRDDEHFRGNHQRADNQHENDVLSRKAVLRKRVTEQRIEKEHRDRRADGDDGRIQEPPRKFGTLGKEDIAVIVERRRIGKELELEYLRRVLQAG